MAIMQSQQATRRNDDPVQQAAAKYMQRVVETLHRRLTPQQQGNELVLTMKTDPSSAGIAVALLLPAVQAARESARRMQSSNSLKQLAIAMHFHHDVHNRLPAIANFDKDGKPLLSWRVHLLPYLDANDLYDEPWDSEHNLRLIEKMPDVYRNPNSAHAAQGMTNYLAIVSKDGVFTGDANGIRFPDITDGLSNTIMIVEADFDKEVIWTKPDDLSFDPQHPLAGLGHVRQGGFQASLVDGSVHFISLNVDAATLKALVTRAGREAIEANALR
jgi:hypothetical protein